MDRTFKGFVTLIVDIITSGLVPIILALATITFLFGVAKYMVRADDASERKKGRKYMVYGLIGLLVGISVWSIVDLFLGLLGVSAIVPQLK